MNDLETERLLRQAAEGTAEIYRKELIRARRWAESWKGKAVEYRGVIRILSGPFK